VGERYRLGDYLVAISQVTTKDKKLKQIRNYAENKLKEGCLRAANVQSNEGE